MSPHMRALHFRTSFQFKLLAIFTLITGLASIIITTLYIITESKHFRDNISSQLNLRAEHLAETIHIPLYAENRLALQQIAEGTAHIPEIQAVIISDRAGKILASTQKSVTSKNADLIRATAFVQNGRLASSPDSAIIEGSEPAAELLGKVYLERGTEDLIRRIHELVIISISLAIGFWLAVSLLCYLVLKKVSKSFNALMQGVHTIKGGDLSSRIEVVSDDEPGMVAHAVNELATSLQQRDIENQQLHQNLRDREQSLKELLAITERDTRIRLSMASANAFLFAWDIDLKTGMVSYSDGAEHILEAITVTDYFSNVRKLALHIHKQDLDRIGPFDARKVSHDEQFRIKGPNDTYVWLEVHGKVIYDSQGEPFRVVGIGQNITERKQYEIAQKRVNALAQDLALAEQRERYRIAEELHDQVGPNLLFCSMKLSSLHSMLPDDTVNDQIEPIEQMIGSCIQDLRSLTFQLRPPILSTAGLVPALKWLASEIQEKYGIDIVITGASAHHQMNIDTRATLFQTVRELLLNVIKHAGTQRASITVEHNAEAIIVKVKDDGIGFDPAVKLIPKSEIQGFGMFNIGQKIVHLGGTIEFDSKPGLGTLVTITVPERKIPESSGEAV